MRLLSVLFLVCSLGSAEVVYPGIGTIAHIADGAGIQMEFALTNLDDTASDYTLRCYDDNGNPLSLVTSAGTNSEFWGTLAPHGSLRIRTAGNSATARQGWATILTNGANVAVSTTFRFSMGSLMGAEATVPADTWRNNRFSLPFDHTGSTVTGLALVNPSETDPIAVKVIVRGEDGGVVVADAFTLGARSHRSMTTTIAYPAIIGMRGTIEISTTGEYMNVVALRVGPSAISFVPPMTASRWAVGNTGCGGCWDY